MSSEVKTVELGEIVDITSSKRIFRKEYVESGIPFYRGKEIIEKSSGNEPSTDIYITKERYNEIKQERGVPQHKDILLTSVGTLGVPYQVQKDEIFYFKDGNLTWIKDFSDEVLPEFIYVWLKSPKAKEDINRITIGSTQQALTITSLKTLELDLPALDQQKKICEIYYGFTDKIRLNQQTNETLEAMAQAIFKSWFVDFDPVRAKIEAASAGHDPNRAAMAAIAGISLEQEWEEIEDALDQKLARMSETQQQQLSRTAELFPDQLVESEIGEVPKGWEVKSFYDTIEIIGGGTPKTKIDEYWDGDILWYSVVDAPNESDVFVIDTEKKITKTGLENSSAKLVDTGTTIISARGTVGKLALTPRPMTYNQSCYGLRSKIDCPYFNFYKTKQLVESLRRGSHGSVFDTITQKTFKTIDIVQPPEKLEKRFDEVVGGLMNKIQKNSEENITLSSLRDTLLPKLISGEVGL